MLSQTAEYALRTAILLAGRPASEWTGAEVIARELDLPRNYLAKTLRQLAAAGVLESTRGKRGGFRVARSPRDITLDEVVRPFEPLQLARQCLLGTGVCSDRTACAAHRLWKPVGKRVTEFFQTTRLADLVGAEGRARRRVMGV